jgi:isoquinoline 1-oxidoreductase alpha subunit
VKAQAPQCGYCQPGFVTAATSVIAAAPNQTREAALSQLSNLCRCGTYDAIREAVGFALEMLRKAPTNLGSAPAPEKAGAGQ